MLGVHSIYELPSIVIGDLSVGRVIRLQDEGEGFGHGWDDWKLGKAFESVSYVLQARRPFNLRGEMLDFPSTLAVEVA